MLQDDIEGRMVFITLKELFKGTGLNVKDITRTELNHLLINPNQVRYYGIPTWENPFDLEKTFWYRSQ